MTCRSASMTENPFFIAVPQGFYNFGFSIIGARETKPDSKLLVHVFSPIENRQSKIQNSSDDFVRPIQHRLRNSETDLLGRFQVDHKLKFCWLLYQEIGGLGALKNLVDVPCRAPETLSVAGCIGYEAADLYVLTSLIHRRQLVLYGKVRNPL